MDSRELRETFVKIYEGSETDLKAFSASVNIRLCGVNSPGFDCAGIAISPNTTAVIRTTDDNNFKLIKSDNDIMYQCRSDLLSKYNEKESIKRLFDAIRLFKGDLHGSEILLVNSADDSKFQADLYAVGIGLSLISHGTPPTVAELESVADSSESLDLLTESLLFSKKNNLLYKHMDGSFEAIPFYMSGCKLIILKIITSCENTAPQIHSAAARLLDSGNSKLSGRYEEYCLNEQKRTEHFFEILKGNPYPTEGMAEIFKSSALDLFSISGRYGSSLYGIFSAAADTDMTEFITSAYDLGGICAAVKDEYVDDFIKKVSDLYEQREGSKPDIYICDTADSGIELKLDDKEITL